MKKTIQLIALLITINLNAQVIDDFNTKLFTQKKMSVGDETYYQSGSTIVGSKRFVNIKIGENPDEQTFEVLIKKNKLVSSIGYGIRGALELRYGYNTTKKLNLKLNKSQHLKIAYEGKSNFGRVYLQMFTNGAPNRAYWRGRSNVSHYFRGSINASNGSTRPFTLSIPLKELILANDNKSATNNFTLDQVDQIRIQFLSPGIPGINFAVTKIWIE